VLAGLLVGPPQSDVEPGRVVEKRVVGQQPLGLQRRDPVRPLALGTGPSRRTQLPAKPLEVALARLVQRRLLLHPHDLGLDDGDPVGQLRALLVPGHHRYLHDSFQAR
jgi:hypothetical protein